VAVEKIRVVLAEDNLLVREGVRRIIESDAELELVAVCDDLDSLFLAIETQAPHVVVTDIRMPPTGTDEGIQAAEHLRRTSPDTGVVVLSQYTDPAYALALLEKGSRGRGYLLKERVSELDQLLGAIREVAAGGSVIDPQVVDALVAARGRAHESQLDLLTPREREILGAIAQGQNNAAISATLVLSERAVEKHINSIFSKLGLSEEPDVHRRVKAVLLFLSEQGG
jgi:DNA-binding NarL/FixJ family response regulator